MNELINVIAVDDHKFHNSSIQEILSDVPHIRLLGTAQTGDEMYLLLKSLRNTSIHIILLDVEMPSVDGGKDGIELARELKSNKSRYNNIKIVCLSMNTQSHVLRTLLKNIRVDGYLDKNETGKEELINAIDSIHSCQDGNHYVSDNLKKKVSRIYSEDNDVREGIDSLTNRQRQIVRYIAEGKTNIEVAKEIGNISKATIDNHRRNIYARLVCKNAAQVATIYYDYTRLHGDDVEGLPNFKRK